MSKRLTLKVGRRLHLESGLSITLKDIVYEEIAQAPGYPGGMGVVAMLILEFGDKSTTLGLDILPEGYDSHSEAEWEGFAIKLIEARGDEAKIKIQDPE